MSFLKLHHHHPQNLQQSTEKGLTQTSGQKKLKTEEEDRQTGTSLPVTFAPKADDMRFGPILRQRVTQRRLVAE
ncbi:hypothetical protein ACOMHN_029108 [Nucella lapillus]